MDQSRISMTTRSPAFLRRSSMLAALAGGSVASRGAGGGADAPAPAMVDYEFAVAAPPETLIPGVPNWALAVGGVAIAGVAVLVLRRRKRGKR